jgi:hypothetical protein
MIDRKTQKNEPSDRRITGFKDPSVRRQNHGARLRVSLSLHNRDEKMFSYREGAE